MGGEGRGGVVVVGGGGGGKGQVVVYTTQAKYKPLHVKTDSIPPTGVCQIFNSLTVIVMEQKLTENYLSWNLTCTVLFLRKIRIEAKQCS